VASCQDCDLSPSDFFEVLFRISFSGVTGRRLDSVHPVGCVWAHDEDIGHEAIVDSLAACTLRKESSVMLRFVTQQVLLFATPAVPEILGVRVDDEATSI